MVESNARYICPSCDAVFDGSVVRADVKCSECSFPDCSYAIHINEGTRKLWMDVESGPRWKRNKKIKKSLRHELCNDAEMANELDLLVDQLFHGFRSRNIDELFPRYREDYNRTIGKQQRLTHVKVRRRGDETKTKGPRKGKRSKRGKKEKYRKKNRTKTKRGAIRGALYEGAFQKLVDLTSDMSRCLETIESPDGKRCRPDAWYDLAGLLNIPIEFKTIGSGEFLINKMKKMLIQSRQQGEIAHYSNLQKGLASENGMSLLIVCSPRDRQYASFLLDNRIEGRLSHLSGRKSKKRLLREKNRKLAEK